MSYLPSHDHMLEATLAHTGLDDLKLCGQRQHTHATVAVAAPSSGSRRSPPRSQISSFPQHAIPQITRLSPSILAPPHRLSPASFNISFMLYFDFVTYVDIATASVLAVALQHRAYLSRSAVLFYGDTLSAHGMQALLHFRDSSSGYFSLSSHILFSSFLPFLVSFLPFLVKIKIITI